MTFDSFPEFYSAIHDRPPFVWQVELLKRVAAEGWPGTIAMPTSSGKTSAIDVAVFHLAMETGKSALKRRAPLRIFFIVDRRIVVDEAYDHALNVALRLRDAKDGILREAASRLQSFGGAVPLQVSRMRGGMLRDNGWADRPNQPTVCLSTVDQVGSRLLFRGYQVGERSRSVHAGLVGNDSLLILDEAHLSNAFHQTLEAVTGKYAAWAEIHPARPPVVVRMSATTAGEGVFDLRPEWVELDANVLGKRLRASKPAELRETKKRFEDEMAAAAKELGTSVQAGVVGVIANTVGSAREIFNKINGDKVLLIGRNRPWMAEKLWGEHKDRIAARSDRKREGLLYVVATQTVEVGANIDFDALVSESAPMDSLRQRFGRLNRLGRDGVARAIIILRPKEDFVYGEPTKTAWAFLTAHQPVDFGVLSMNVTLEGIDPGELAAMNSKPSRAPLMFPLHLEWWAQTSPEPEPSPDVAPFLHGPDALDAADVQIVWREDLWTENGDLRPDAVELMPPVQRESLGMPLGAVRRWLRDQTQEIADIEGIELKGPEEKTWTTGKPVLRWRSGGATEEYANALRPGDTIVVPTSYGGVDTYGWNPGVESAPDADIADQVNADEAKQGVRRRCIRLSVAASSYPGLNESLKQLRKDHDSEIERQILELLDPSRTDGRIDSLARVAIWPRTAREATAIEPATEESDENDDGSLTVAASLEDHTAGVVSHARAFAAGCGISAGLADDIHLAARLHDWGKCDERFQAWLTGKPFKYDGKYLAKSAGNRSMGENRELRKWAKYPENARHEAASVMAAFASGLLGEAHDPDLVLHLIGTHHGCGRPFFPVWKDDVGFTIQVEAEGKSFDTPTGNSLARIDSGWVDRFALLNRRHGYWGLAYLEAILRRADCMQSRKEQLDATNKTNRA